jgi:hypothetical protein
MDDDQLVDLPGFAPPTTTGPDPLDPETTTITGPTADPLEDPTSGLEDGWPGDESDEPTFSPGSTPTSGRSRASTADWRDFAELTGTLVALASVGVRFARTRRRQLPEGVWMADEDDQAAIGVPLARIAARHSPLEGGDSSDVVDGLVAMVGVAGYAVKNIDAEHRTAGPMPDLTAAEADA